VGYPWARQAPPDSTGSEQLELWLCRKLNSM